VLHRPVETAKLNKPTQSDLDVLGEFLEEGIKKILNKPVTGINDLQDLIKIESDWNARLFAHLDENFPIADAKHIKNLGTVDSKDFVHARGFPEHAAVLSRFSRREEKIGDIIKRGTHH
jgi:hypothetical protein